MRIMHIELSKDAAFLKPFLFYILYTVQFLLDNLTYIHIYIFFFFFYISIMPACLSKNTFLPSSSSSEVIDLDRKVSAVVGARLGGGGALH